MIDACKTSCHNLVMRLGKWPETIFLLLLGFCVIWYGSTSSPRYGWMSAPDANIYLTMGQAWLSDGMFPYASLFDHKGPLVFLINGVASLMDPGGYLGLYILESLFLGGIFVLWHRMALMLAGSQSRRIALLSVGLMAVAIGSKALLPRLSDSLSIMSEGGEAELYILFFETLSLFALLQLRMSRKCFWPIAAGVALACVALLKFNLVVYYPFFWGAVYLSGRSGTWMGAVRSVAWQIAGFLSVIGVCALVFVVNGYGYCLWAAYIKYNMAYSPTLWGNLTNLRSLFLVNTAFVSFCLIGSLAFGWFLCRRADSRGRVCMLLTALSYLVLLLLMNGVRIGPGYIYYLLPFLPFFFSGVLLFFHGLSVLGKSWEYILPAAVALLYIRDTTITRPDVYENGPVIHEMAHEIKQHAQGKPIRLLCYGCMDIGMYRALCIEPTVFYYMQPNDSIQPNHLAPGSIGWTQDQYIRDGLVDYVLMMGPRGNMEKQEKNPRSLRLMQELVERGEWELLGTSRPFSFDKEIRIYARCRRP